MNNYLRPCLCAAALCLLPLGATPAMSDTMKTQCEVYKGGDLKKKSSGDCEFSQHQGVVVLKLANGDVRTLTPTGKANEYKSKAGDKVTREMDGGDQVYKWKDRTIRVSMGGGGNGNQGGGGWAVDRSDSDYTCLLFESGEKNNPGSGPCQFSQHQGNVHLKLHDGTEYDLAIGNGANQYRDQGGKKVTRAINGQTQVYHWDRQRVEVYYGNAPSGGGNSGGNKHAAGQPVPELQDLVGQRGGNATDKLINRGYEMKNNANSGKFNYSNWRKKGSGQCITLRTEDGLFLSIVYSTDLDCKGR